MKTKNLTLTIMTAGVLTVLVAAAGMPFGISAAEFMVPSDTSVNAQVSLENSTSDIYAAGALISGSPELAGDLWAAGSELTLGEGTIIRGDVNLGGGMVALQGSYADDLRIGAGQVTLSGTVGDDLFIGAGTAEVQGTVAGDVYIGGGEVTLSGNYRGDVRVAADQLVLRDDTVINGKLIYQGAAEVIKGDNVSISGEETFTKIDLNQEKWGKMTIAHWIISVAALLIMLLVVLYLAPLKSIDTTRLFRTKFWSSLGWGILALIVTPIAGLILMVTVVGLPLAASALAVYGIAIYLAQGYFALVIGEWLLRRLRPQLENSRSRWQWGALFGVAVLKLIQAIPYVGMFIILVGSVAAFGAMVMVARETMMPKTKDHA